MQALLVLISCPDWAANSVICPPAGNFAMKNMNSTSSGLMGRLGVESHSSWLFTIHTIIWETNFVISETQSQVLDKGN